MCGCEVDGGAVVRLALTSRNRHRPGLGEVESRMCVECQTGNERFAEFCIMSVGKLRLPQQIHTLERHFAEDIGSRDGWCDVGRRLLISRMRNTVLEAKETVGMRAATLWT